MSERGTIVVDGRSWHRRVYGYWGRKIAHDPPETLNLCLYMRAVLIYVPGYFLLLAFALTAGTVGLIVTSPLWVPFFMLWLVSARARRRINRLLDNLGQTTTATVLVVAVVVWILVMLVVAAMDVWWLPLLIIGTVVGTIAALVGVSLLVEKRREKNSDDSETTSSGVAKLSWSWLRAKKHRICPLIETRDGQ